MIEEDLTGRPVLAIVLRALMQRKTYRATPGMLAKLSGLPRATIINWLEGRVSRPRHREDLIAVSDALRLDDSETKALFEAAGYSTIVETQPTRIETRTPLSRVLATQLPRQTSRLFGRDAAVLDIRELLAAEKTRIVTLVGTAGVGKTRLAIAAAESVAAIFPDGVVWVPLASVVEPTEVAHRIMLALSIGESDAGSTATSIAQVLRNNRVLLVLDNFEHLLTAGSVLSEIAQATEHATMLVTSRTALRVESEREFHVRPLATPNLSLLPPLEELERCESVQLFLERARRAGNELRLTEASARTVAEICTRLDGLPFALELAASRTKILPLTDLLRRLEEPFTLLTNASQDVHGRHRDLRSVIGWSYALLSPNEQRLLRRLAVCSGGISVSAAAAVAGIDDPGDVPATNDLLDTAARLVEQNMLTVTVDEELGTRFVMLETIREYALEKLDEADEAAEAKRRHALFFLIFLENADRRLEYLPSVAWLRRIRPECDNFQTALASLLRDPPDGTAALRFVTALSNYWIEGGQFIEARRGLERLRDLAEAEPRYGAKLLFLLATVADQQGDFTGSAEIARRAVNAYERLDDRAGAARSTVLVATAMTHGIEVGKAERLLRGALVTLRRLSDRRGAALALRALGEYALEQRLDVVAAQCCLEESLETFRDLGLCADAGSTLGLLSEVARMRGELNVARSLSNEALGMFRVLNHNPFVAAELVRLSGIDVADRKSDDAFSSLSEVGELLQRSFNARLATQFFDALGLFAFSTESVASAARSLSYSDQIRDDFGIPRSPAELQKLRKVREAIETVPSDDEDDAGEAVDPFIVVGNALRLATRILA